MVWRLSGFEIGSSPCGCQGAGRRKAQSPLVRRTYIAQIPRVLVPEAARQKAAPEITLW